MKLKYARYFGQFYEYQGQLGWMPWYKAIITDFHLMLSPMKDFKWIPQRMVTFGK